MDETRLRAVIREEIALAMKTLGAVAGSTAGSLSEDRAGERDGAYAIESAAGVFFESAYEANCAVADEQRAQDAANPFKEAEGEAGVDKATETFVRGEVVRAFRALGAAANELDMPYETSELDSRALSNIEQAARRAAYNYESPDDDE